MNRRRVVITGHGMVTPIGHTVAETVASIRAGRHGIRYMNEWEGIGQLDTRVAAPVEGLDLEEIYKRHERRTMGRVALLACYATDQAIADAGFEVSELRSGRVGIAHGSTHGSTHALEAWTRTVFGNMGMRGVASSAYLKFMSHTTCANLAQRYAIIGPAITTCSACVSGSHAIGAGYNAIRWNQADVMVCGGSEELHFTHAGVFDIMFATSSRHNDEPGHAPRPFDAERDGIVVGEGAGTLILEELEHAKRRGARIHGEVLGYGSNCDGTHVTSPSSEGMAGAMRLALEDANLDASAIDYVCAHATATDVGDIAESVATREVLGTKVPISSIKSFMGHTLGACGAIETSLCLEMMRDGWISPNRNLYEVDPRCAPLHYVGRELEQAELNITMNNNFAFGGLNTSIVVGRL